MPYRNRKCASRVIAFFWMYSLIVRGEERMPGVTGVASPSEGWQQGITPADAGDNAMRGNWLKKLKYFRQAEVVYNKNEADIQRLNSANGTFQETYRAELNASVLAMRKLEFKEDDLKFIEAHYRELMASDRAEEYVVAWSSLDIGSLFAKIYDAAKDYDQLKRLVESSLTAADNQVAIAKSYSDESWKKYVAIDNTYNDIMAKVLLDEMQAMNNHINDIEVYITQELTAYCHERVSLMNQQLHVIESVYTTLRLKKFPLSLDEFNTIKKSQESVSVIVPSSEQGFWAKTWQLIIYPFQWLWNKIV